MTLKKMYIMIRLKNIEDKIRNITNLVTNTFPIAKINEFKVEIPSITNLNTTAALITVENKLPNVSNLVKKVTITQKLMKWKRKLLILINILLF